MKNLFLLLIAIFLFACNENGVENSNTKQSGPSNLIFKLDSICIENDDPGIMWVTADTIFKTNNCKRILLEFDSESNIDSIDGNFVLETVVSDTTELNTFNSLILINANECNVHHSYQVNLPSLASFLVKFQLGIWWINNSENFKIGFKNIRVYKVN